MNSKQPTTQSKEQAEKTNEASGSIKKEPSKRKKGVSKNVFTSGPDEGAQWINPAVEPIIRQQTGNPSYTFLRRNPHHSILQLPLQPNVLTKDTLLSHFKTTRPFTASLPTPLHTTPGLGPSTPDLMVRYLHTKHAYQRELHSLEKKYKKVAADHPLDRHDNDVAETVEHTVAVIYAALLDRDPDPYLKQDTDYDYHFTGGAMVAIPGRASSATIFKACGECLQDVEVLRIHHDGRDWNVKEVQACATDMADPVLELVSGDGGKVILVRKRYLIIVLREMHVAPDRTEWRPVQQFFSLNPLASVCFVGGPTLTLCATDYEHNLQLLTISDEELTCEHIVQLPPSSQNYSHNVKGNWKAYRKDDQWTAVRCVDGHSLVACLDRTRIHFYTVIRNKTSNDESQLVYRGADEFSRWISPCEQCCALEVTHSEGLLFIATGHKLIVGKIEEHASKHPVDESEQNKRSSSESGTDNIAVKVLLVFAHNLKQYPVFLNHQWDARAGLHFVLFGSHLPMSYGVASFTRSSNPSDPCGGQVYATQHFPYHPPTFHDTYKQAQRQGHCLSAYEPLRKRFYACQSGAVLLRIGRPTVNEEREEPRLHILLQTSAGDVLQQRLSYDFDREEKQHDRKQTQEHQHIGSLLQHWHDRLVKQAGRIPYRATNFKTMRKFRDIFNCPIEGSELKEILFLPPEVKQKQKRRKKSTLSGQDEEEEEEEEEDGNEAYNDEEDEGVWFSSQSVASGSTNAGEPSVIRRQRKYGFKPPLPWRQTLEDLQQYRDVLAPAMLSVWGIGNADVPAQATNLEQIPTKLPPLSDIHERVGSWVNASTTEQRDTAEIGVEEDLIVPKKAVATEEYGVQQLEEGEQEEELFSQPLTQSQFISASQQSQQMGHSSVRPTVTRPSRKVYSKGF
uniref:Uncharacterized protein n=1 Tax=Anopheles christyi TaxID=43041 RepID=A0A182JRL8_9DIPT